MMPRCYTKLLILTVVLSTFGCGQSESETSQVRRGTPTQGQVAPIREPLKCDDWNNWRSLQLGMSTVEVETVLGPPTRVAKLSQLCWQYDSGDSKVFSEWAQALSYGRHFVIFDQDNRLAGYEVNALRVGEGFTSDTKRWQKLQTGMTEVQVLECLGVPRYFSHTRGGIAEWCNSERSFWDVTKTCFVLFDENGRVTVWEQ